MNRPIDPETWFHEERSVAALIPADRLFGLLKRSFELPPTFCAKTTHRSGEQRVHAPGEELTADDVTEVMFARTQPFDVSLSVRQLPSQDKYLCDASVRLQIRILPERAELDSFRDQVMGSRPAVSYEAVESFLHPAIDAALRIITQEHAAVALVDGEHSGLAAAALTESLAGPCFAGGMTVANQPSVRFASPAVAKIRQAREQAARKLGEHQAQNQLREALAKAQNKKLAHLESMLAKLKELADDAPEIGLPQLMRAFDESQRGQLYQALFESHARRRVTQWIVVVAGHDVLFFDPQSPARPARRVPINGAAGALRSVQLASSGGDDESRLLLGAARGVYEMGIERSEPDRTYLYEAEAEVHGGVNAAAMTSTDLVATHSEQGIVHWRLGDPQHPARLLPDVTATAKAVRNATFAGDQFWCSIDAKIIHLPSDNLQDQPQIIDTGHAVITALCPAGQFLYAGNADGEVLQVSITPGTAPQTVHAGSRRPAESVSLITGGAIPRLFYTDTTLAVFSRVLGDTFTCRYEAGGQTLRRAAVAEDLITATTDARDRIVVWTPNQTQKPAAVIPVSQLTGRSVQDVCLVPRA